MSLQNTNIKFVTTFDGQKARREDCKYIKGEYFIKDIQCFFINNNWYRITSSKIVFDYELKKFVIKSNNLIFGVIGISGEDNTPKFGNFSPHPDNTFLFHLGYTYTVIRENVLENSPLIKEGLTGVYYYTNQLVPIQFTQKVKPIKEDFYSYPFNYGSDPLIPTFSRDFFSNFDFSKISLKSNDYTLIEDYSFGIEFETERGAIPEKHIKNSGLIPCRDGSISGFEYTTIPLQGEKGIKCIKNACYLLQKYCACSVNESLHIHIGNYPKKVKHIVALYKLGLLIENEIYSLFPYYYVNTSNFKRKSYCNPLYQVDTTQDVKNIFLGIYSYLSGGQQNFTKFPTSNHPLDRSGQHKWDVSPRYHWLNLIPLIWGHRGTVEFRCHVPTLNAQKVINWLYIVVAILKYAKKHVTKLTNNNNLSVNLKNIIMEAYPKKISTILISYINDRKKHYNKKQDFVGETEILGEFDKKEIFTLSEFI